MIHETAIIYKNVKIGKNVHIGPYCIIGAPAESKKYWNTPCEYGVEIKDGAIITGHVTIDSGSVNDTIIGSNCFIMKGVHIGHDAIIYDDVTLSPHVVVGGHVEIGRNTNVGIAAVIHQRCKVPSGCMIGMNTTITKSTMMDVDRVYIGSPAKFLRWNKRK